ncbi:hypothetical protein QTG54_010756 [Skeletonema marinoi]|uniref:Uncharacterized protein n=1 Tax=Skeletonema marinoi TaxID=267567 RepID=A0AAD8Y314_9STRA|nr:hypothetical protein QTG54_010756 [Skeletonema marinoi]
MLKCKLNTSIAKQPTMWTKKTSLAALLISARYGSGVDAQKIRSPKSSKNPSIKSSKAPTSKAGKKVCLEFGFLNDVVGEGSPVAIGADGPNGFLACYPGFPNDLTAPPLASAVCCAELSLCVAGYASSECDPYFECLQDPDNGPVLVGDWWLQRDVNNGEMFFEDDAVCGRINSAALNSRTRFELWNDVHLGMDLGLFKEFSVGYDYRALGGGSGGYLNMYLRVDETSTAYYDCNLVFNIPNAVGTGTLLVTPETVVSSARTFSSGDANGCIAGTTIEDYLAANEDAVMGVGNGELYTFALNTGSTDQDNSGSEICWGDVSIKHVDEAGTVYATTFEFTTLV